MRAMRVAIAAFTALALLVPLTSVPVAADGPHTLVDIRAAQHVGHDRIVFEFLGGLPHDTTWHWNDAAPPEMPGNLPSVEQGEAYIHVTFDFVTGTEKVAPYGTTYGVEDRAYDLPNLLEIHTVQREVGTLSFALGVMHKTEVLSVRELTDPPRVVFEISSDFARTPVSIWFADRDTFAGGPPYMVAVQRTVPTHDIQRGVMRRLFAGPTLGEKADGLTLVRSQATGWTDLRVTDSGIARVQLTGGCKLGPAPVSIGKEITRTLKDLPGIGWVKIYGPYGQTSDPDHQTDSLPECLIP